MKEYTEYEERAAIYEYDAMMTREEAERQAENDTQPKPQLEQLNLFTKS